MMKHDKIIRDEARFIILGLNLIGSLWREDEEMADGDGSEDPLHHLVIVLHSA